jgi:hypothetical protein
MDRRLFLAALGYPGAQALLEGISGGVKAAHAGASSVCGIDKTLKTKVCTVKVTGPLQMARAGSFGAGACWLSCLQMLAGFQGYQTSAAALLTELYGGKLPKEPWTDTSIHGKQFSAAKGRRGVIGFSKLPVRAAEAAELLHENQPLIIGAGHPVLLTTIRYTGDRLGGMTVVDSTVLDPAPGKGARLVSSPEWVNVTFISQISIKKASAA